MLTLYQKYSLQYNFCLLMQFLLLLSSHSLIRIYTKSDQEMINRFYTYICDDILGVLPQKHNNPTK